ncbi:MAG: AbrB/MazE/SpoVT family DNA-binding domain-containing protein [Rubrivivax sp.]
MPEAKLFTHGGSQAVRLPKEFRFDGTSVHVRRVGDEVVLSALPQPGPDALLDALRAFDLTAPIRREQPPRQQRRADIGAGD